MTLPETFYETAFWTLVPVLVGGIGVYAVFFRNVMTEKKCEKFEALRSEAVQVTIDYLKEGQDAQKEDIRQIRKDVSEILRVVNGGPRDG